MSNVWRIEWSSDGKRLATASRKSDKVEICIWNTNTWEPLAVIDGLRSHSSLFTWNPHLPLMTTVGQQEGDLLVWQLDLEHLLNETHSPEMVHYKNAKVVLVGDSGVGKSGLALVLTGQPFVPTDSTHGRHVRLFDQQEVLLDSGLYETREIWLWDLAGQPDYRLIHQLHLHEATIALIVFDPARETDPFAGVRHWHRAIQLAQQASKSATVPTIFLIAARMDRGGRSMSQARIDNLVQELRCTGYLETSAKNGRGIAELSQIIQASLDWTILPTITSTKLLQAIKMFVRHEQQAGQLLRTVDELYQTFLHTPDAPVPSDELQRQFEVALDRLAALGDIRWLRFGNLVLLQPEVLDSYASAVLIAAKDEPDGLGYISEERVRQGHFAIPQERNLHNRDQEQLLLIAMIDELVRHELALREGGSLLFPSQSTCEHPEHTILIEKQSVIFTFAGQVLSIYTTLVVRLAQCGIFQKQGLWQHVVTYKTSLGGTYGLLLSPRGEERAELGLFFDESAREEMCFHFEDFVQAHLERHTGGTVQRRRRFICSNCGDAFTETQINNRRKRGFDFIRCSTCDTSVSLLDGKERLSGSPPSLVTRMEQTANAQRDRESAFTIQQGNVIVQEPTSCTNIYISSASTPEDQTLLEELEKQLSMLKRQPDIHLWDKRGIKPGAIRRQEIATYISQAHLILFLLSPDFLASDECYEEMIQAIWSTDAEEARIIPILMRPIANWQNIPIGQLEPLPADRESISNRADRENVLRDIAEHIGQIIDKIRQRKEQQ